MKGHRRDQIAEGPGDGSLRRSKWRRRLGGYATQMKSRGDAEANGGASQAMARAAMVQGGAARRKDVAGEREPHGEKVLKVVG